MRQKYFSRDKTTQIFPPVKYEPSETRLWRTIKLPISPGYSKDSPFSESVSRKRSGCSGSSAIITIQPTTDTFLFDVDLN